MFIQVVVARMASPTRNIALRYLESISDGTPTRLPLQPSLKHNHTPRTKTADADDGQDLDKLARQLDVQSTSPSKTALLRTRFESPSATVSLFKTPSRPGSSNGSSGGSPKRQTRPEIDLAAKNTPKSVFSANSGLSAPKTSAKLSPLKQNLETPSRPSRPFLSLPSNSTLRESPGYEYLCRILAIKNWLEGVLEEEISQNPVELIPYVRNGIHLAKLANMVLPVQKNVFTDDSRLQFRHTENINRFFQLLDYMNVPDLFRFELTDLYDAKNVPKVWFCLHAMSYMLQKVNLGYGEMENLVGSVDFLEDDIRAANRALVGSGLPNFTSADTGDTGSSRFMNRAIDKSPIREREREAPRKELVLVSRGTDAENPFRERLDVHGLPRKVSIERSTSTRRFADFSVGPEPSRSMDTPSRTLQTPSRSTEMFSRDTDTFTKSTDASTDLPYGTTPTNRYTRYLETESLPQPVLDTHYRDSPYYRPELEELVPQIVKVQALGAGAVFRYRMFVDRILLRLYGDEFTQFASVIRGNLARRKTVHRHRDELLCYQRQIVGLQTAGRAQLARRRCRVDFSALETPMVRFQAAVRAATIRVQIASTQRALLRARTCTQTLQAAARSNLVRRKAAVVLPEKDRIEPLVIAFQAVARRVLQARGANSRVVAKMAGSGGVVQLQALVRGQRMRAETARKLRAAANCARSVRELQSIGRGGIARTCLCNTILVNLLYEDGAMNRLLAKARANSVRADVANKKKVLRAVERTGIVPLQSRFRGILARFGREANLGDVYGSVHSIIGLQAVARAAISRRRVVQMHQYYRARTAQVVRAQAIIRSRCTQNAYKQLLSTKNPPLAVIKRFAHLLTDNDRDYQEEMQLSAIKDLIIEKSRANEDLELQIEHFDIKLGLLERNKISVEEFRKHKVKTDVPKLAAALDRLNRLARDRIDVYQSLFYFLQTKPVYLVRLYGCLNVAAKELDFYHDLQRLVLLIFPIKSLSVGQHLREEFFFVRFVCELMAHDVRTLCNNISDLTKSQACFWIEYFLYFNNHTYQRMHLKLVMARVVSHVIENDDLLFESDPAEIYDQLVEKEYRIHGHMERPKGLLAQAAIKDPEVSAVFVENLMSLREHASDVLNVLQKALPKVPLHIKLICRQGYRLSQLQFPEKTDNQHLAVAGVIFVKHYVLAIFQSPENYGFLVKDPFNPALHNTKAAANLRHLSRVMLQVFSMKPFSDNFLKPLNDYVASSAETTRTMIQKLVSVGDIDSEYGLSDYDDIVTRERPHLAMKLSDMILVEKMVQKHLDAMAPSADDQLYGLCTKLEGMVNSADDFVALTELGVVNLSLNPTSKEDLIADTKSQQLLTQAKRCVLYIIRIQDGRDLLELLVSAITPAHEALFREIVSAEKKEAMESSSNEKKRPYYKTSLGNLSETTYHELKKMALENLLQLEFMGLLTRKNGFQELLNRIAVDIKTKDTQRNGRRSQLDIAIKTSLKLEEKEHFLTSQLADYNRHIDKVLGDLQLKPKDRRFLNVIPIFSKQYFYQRQLKKHNRLPRFGSYKYSAKKLMDQEVLLNMTGVVNQKYASSSKLDFMFSCHEVGKFVVEAASGPVNIPGASHTITLDELLNLQYENRHTLEVFDGMVVFNTENFAAFIFRKFYDLKRE